MKNNEIPPIFIETLKSGILPLFAVASDARWHPVGTAFVIAVPEPKTALLLTAAHNLRFVQKIDAPHNLHHSTIAPEFRPVPQSRADLSHTTVYVFVKSNGKFALAEMTRSWFKEAFDVALMLVKIRPNDDVTFKYQIALDSTPIKEGTSIMAAGYPLMNANFTAEPSYETKDFRVGVELQLQTRGGKVIKVCPQGDGINRWPGFLVGCPFDSGMSGGPVIEFSGSIPLVRGIVSSDISEKTENNAQGSGSRAFASMLWPAMMIKTQIALANENGDLIAPENSQLLDLVRWGLVDDHGKAHKHVKVSQTTTGFAYSWNWNVPPS